MSACHVLLATQGDGGGTCEAKRAGCHTLAVTLPCTFRRMRCGPSAHDGGACNIVSEEFTRYLPPTGMLVVLYVTRLREGRTHSNTYVRALGYISFHPPQTCAHNIERSTYMHYTMSACSGHQQQHEAAHERPLPCHGILPVSRHKRDHSHPCSSVFIY